MINYMIFKMNRIPTKLKVIVVFLILIIGVSVLSFTLLPVLFWASLKNHNTSGLTQLIISDTVQERVLKQHSGEDIIYKKLSKQNLVFLYKQKYPDIKKEEEKKIAILEEFVNRGVKENIEEIKLLVDNSLEKDIAFLKSLLKKSDVSLELKKVTSRIVLENKIIESSLIYENIADLIKETANYANINKINAFDKVFTENVKSIEKINVLRSFGYKYKSTPDVLLNLMSENIKDIKEIEVKRNSFEYYVTSGFPISTEAIEKAIDLSVNEDYFYIITLKKYNKLNGFLEKGKKVEYKNKIKNNQKLKRIFEIKDNFEDLIIKRDLKEIKKISNKIIENNVSSLSFEMYDDLIRENQNDIFMTIATKKIEEIKEKSSGNNLLHKAKLYKNEVVASFLEIQFPKLITEVNYEGDLPNEM